MSYDLAVYLPRALSETELDALVSSAGLGVEAVSPEALTVVRGARRSYCFTLEGPVPVEPEDLPTVVVAAVLDASARYTVMVEGSADVDVPHAVKFARRMAREFGGAAFDEQTDQMWSAGGQRRVGRPVRQERVDVVELEWFVTRPALNRTAALDYLRLCRHLLPEALPRRFGDVEPLRHVLAEDGDEGFDAAWRHADTLFFNATAPCVGGSFWDGPESPGPGPLWKMQLSVLRTPLHDRRWREATERLFLRLAEQLGAFFASAEVIRGYLWSGRGLTVDGQVDDTDPVATVSGWNRLPSYPLWWSWYGPTQLAHIADQLPGARHLNEALFHQWTDEPTDREQLTQLAAARCGITSGRWSPPDLHPK